MGRVRSEIKQNANKGKGLRLENPRWTRADPQGMLLPVDLPQLWGLQSWRLVSFWFSSW